ncbi:MAG: RluA family pseudouridine synthase [Ignavibacteriales bacterium]|nr:RluA family pseudouridine synthase [Ignavibacteriales bacterium]
MRRKLDWLLKSKGIQIAYEDEDIIVLNKPAPFLVIPDRYDESIPNIYRILIGELPEVFVVHRIDKETSGLVVFARTEGAHKGLSEQFEERGVEKVYEAIVRGRPEHSDATIDLPLREKIRGVMSVDKKKGKDSVTRYSVLERFNGFAHLEVRPETGRMHQIRVHLRAVGLPILCDSVYGGGSGFYLSEVKSGYKKKVEEEEEVEEKPLIARTALHAAGLSFQHPVTGKEMRFESGLPKDMRSAIRMIEKYAGREREV